MADDTPDSPAGRPARPAVPPFRGPAAPAAPAAPAGVPGRPAIARPAAAPGSRATLPPFAAPTGAPPRRATPASSPALARPVGGRPATPPRVEQQAIPPVAPPVESTRVDATTGAGAGRSAVPHPEEWLSPDSAVRGEFGDLVDHRPAASTQPPTLPTPPMPWPAVAAQTDEPANGDDFGWDELTADAPRAASAGAADAGAATGADGDWSMAYEAEAAALLGDDEASGAEAGDVGTVDAATYLAEDGPAPSAGGDPPYAEIPPSMLPTPVMGVGTVEGGFHGAADGEGASSVAAPFGEELDASAPGYHVAPPDPLLADAMRDDAEAIADAWSDPLADEPLGGSSRDEPMGAYGAATPYMVAAHDYGTGAAGMGGDADAVADALERVAAWVRSGELPVSVPPAQAPSEAQALTAALAALLGLGAQR